MKKTAGIFSKKYRVLHSTKINLKVNLQLYNTIVLLTTMHTSEAWKDAVAILKTLDVFQQRCRQKVLKNWFHNNMTSNAVLQYSQSRILQDMVA